MLLVARKPPVVAKVLEKEPTTRSAPPDRPQLLGDLAVVQVGEPDDLLRGGGRPHPEAGVGQLVDQDGVTGTHHGRHRAVERGRLRWFELVLVGELWCPHVGRIDARHVYAFVSFSSIRRTSK